MVARQRMLAALLFMVGSQLASGAIDMSVGSLFGAGGAAPAAVAAAPPPVVTAPAAVPDPAPAPAPVKAADPAAPPPVVTVTSPDPAPAPVAPPPVAPPPVASPTPAVVAAPTTVAPTPAAPPPPAVVPSPTPASEPTTIAGCSAYMAKTGCGWSQKYNCPGQAVGTSGVAKNDGSQGFTCCCSLGLWNDIATTPVDPGVGPKKLTEAELQGPGPLHHAGKSLAFETIPRSIKLKYKLMQWFEDQGQCPLNMNGAFPAWVGWKAVTAAAPAVTTPPKGVAGNRTLNVRGFCSVPVFNKETGLTKPGNGIRSELFECVRTDTEIKARALNRIVSIDLDNVKCELTDISLYKMASGFVGVRFDFGICEGHSNVGAAQPHIPQSASLNMGLGQEAAAMSASPLTSTNFSEFFKAVCEKGPRSDFFTVNLPKFARAAGALGPNVTKPTLVPSCFAESANAGHVIGKGCFQDFIYFDLEDMNGKLATVPTKDLAGLTALIPRAQHWRHPVPAPAGAAALVATAAAAVVAPAAVPTPAPPPLEVDPCAPMKPTCAMFQCVAPYVQRPFADRIECKGVARKLGDKDVAADPCAPATTAAPDAVPAKPDATPAPTPPPAPPAKPLPPATCGANNLDLCCIPGTTTTTTPFIQEVPGVVIADRVCIFFHVCGNCANYCDCSPKAEIKSADIIKAHIKSINGGGAGAGHGRDGKVCEDFWVETVLIAVLAFIISTILCIFLHEKCVSTFFKKVSVTETKANQNPGAQITNMLETMHSGIPGGVAYDPLLSRGVGQGLGKFNVNTSETKTSSNGCGQSFCHFFLTGIITFCVVHLVCWLYTLLASAVFNTTKDGVWNSIDLKDCPFSLWGIWIALWMMMWFNLTYYYGWQTKIQRTHTANTPMMVGGNMVSPGGGGLFGF